MSIAITIFPGQGKVSDRDVERKVLRRDGTPCEKGDVKKTNIDKPKIRMGGKAIMPQLNKLEDASTILRENKILRRAQDDLNALTSVIHQKVEQVLSDEKLNSQHPNLKFYNTFREKKSVIPSEEKVVATFEADAA